MTKTKKTAKKEVTKDMKISKIVERYPDSAGVMMSFGLHCVGCHVSDIETLEQGIKGHGGTDEHVNMVVKEINKFIQGKSESCGPSCACH